jgi:hypothetical protein
VITLGEATYPGRAKSEATADLKLQGTATLSGNVNDNPDLPVVSADGVVNGGTGAWNRHSLSPLPAKARPEPGEEPDCEMNVGIGI